MPAANTPAPRTPSRMHLRRTSKPSAQCPVPSAQPIEWERDWIREETGYEPETSDQRKRTQHQSDIRQELLLVTVTQCRPSRSRPPPNPPAASQPAQPATKPRSLCTVTHTTSPTPLNTPHLPSPYPLPPIPPPSPPSPLHIDSLRPARTVLCIRRHLSSSNPHDTRRPRDKASLPARPCNPISQSAVAPFNRPTVAPSPVTSYDPRGPQEPYGHKIPYACSTD